MSANGSMTENRTFAEHTQIQLYNTKNDFGSEQDKVQKVLQDKCSTYTDGCSFAKIKNILKSLRMIISLITS